MISYLVCYVGTTMNEEKLREHRYPVHTANGIIERCSKILFRKRRNESYKGKLVIPGGTLNKGERVEAAAIRSKRRDILRFRT